MTEVKKAVHPVNSPNYSAAPEKISMANFVMHIVPQFFFFNVFKKFCRWRLGGTQQAKPLLRMLTFTWAPVQIPAAPLPIPDNEAHGVCGCLERKPASDCALSIGL